jgi:DNA-directed RNA polymerase beta subunit
LIQNKLRIGMRRMERVIKERMSIREQDRWPQEPDHIRAWWLPCVNSMVQPAITIHDQPTRWLIAP